MTFKALFAGLVCICFIATGCDNSDPDDEVPEAPLPRAVADSLFTLTDTGLKYYDFEIGDSTRAVADSGEVVLVHYHGWLTDGFLFDSSILRNQPIQIVLGVGQVIPGWDEGLAGMNLGGERQLVIPPELAYRDQQRGNIPPNSTLIFEVFLVGAQ